MILILSLQIKECLSRKLSLGSFGSDFFDISGRLLVKIEAPWQGTLDLNAFFYIAHVNIETITHIATAHHSLAFRVKKKKILCVAAGKSSLGVFFLCYTPKFKKICNYRTGGTSVLV